MKIYRGLRIGNTLPVSVNGVMIDALAGSSHLAYAILLDVTGSEQVAFEHSHAFERQWLAEWGDEWSVTEAEVREWLDLGHTRMG